jgi:hypothetical protein
MSVKYCCSDSSRLNAKLTSANQLLALLLLCVSGTTPAVAGPYAALAAQARANGGVLQIFAMGGLETQSAATLDATAVRACHTIALEGVTVTSVRIVTQGGQLLRLVSGTTLAGC